MAIHKPWDRPFYVVGGSIMKNGFSLNLAEGQFGIFNVSQQTPKGAVAVEAFKGNGSDTLFELRLGNKQKMTRSTTNKMYSSFPFSIHDVVSLKASAPKRTEMKVDEVVIGYNGINAETSLKLFHGEHKEISLQLEGKQLEYLGVPEGIATFIIPLDTKPFYGVCGPDEDPCAPVDMLPIINEAVEYAKNLEFRGGTKITDVVEITPVIDLAGVKRTGELVQVTFQMSICDTGDQGALALVQQQYPQAEVTLAKRVGAISTYQVVVKQSVGGAVPTAPTAYTQTLPSIIKGCEECPAGYDEVEGGFVYAVLLEDDGADLSTAVEAMTNAVKGTAIKGEAQNFGKGMYTVVVTSKLTPENITTFVTTNPTATVDLVGSVSSICSNDTVATATWAETSRVTFTTSTWKITLPDAECGQSRLAELQTAYPFNTVIETEVEGGCQREYQITTTTNTIDEQCDPIYQDTFVGTAPASYQGVKWVNTTAAVDGTAGKYGIRFKAKTIKIASGEALRDQLAFVEDAVRINVSGGYITDFNWSTTGGRVEDKPFAVSYLSRYEPRTHVGGNLLDDEVRARTYFTGRLMDYDYMGRILSGNESNILDLNAQYVDYALTLRRSIYSQGLSQRLEENITYHIMVEVGRHQEIEEVLNSLAAANGLPGAKAFPSLPAAETP